ncbi:uncharacterized protein PAC_15619 [Phialocephala subalpina]|uniref:Fungal N-terminal domain-containing protein n=1 Tax=Phialocephala subalpina TaxID=576137 RepID=A0A1L7XL02_9HELO|nr:uncharacterized protein PAC_15619 [Phialocephala subalpina]
MLTQYTELRLHLIPGETKDPCCLEVSSQPRLIFPSDNRHELRRFDRDIIVILQLAWNTLQGAKQACGEHGELTREVESLHKALSRVQREMAKSPLGPVNDERRKELDEQLSGCEKILRVIDSVLQKYNALGDDKKKGKRLWQKIKFGNGEMRDLSEIRLKLSVHTTAIMMSLKLYTLGSLGRVETELQNQGGDLRGIRASIDWIMANMTTSRRAADEGSVWTAYENDNKEFWRELRRHLHKEGFSKSNLQEKQDLVMAYVEELGNRRVFDEEESDGEDMPPEVECMDQISVQGPLQTTERTQEHIEGDGGSLDHQTDGSDGDTDTQSIYTSSSSKSSINNSRLLETVSDAIRRLILPELMALKKKKLEQEQ